MWFASLVLHVNVIRRRREDDKCTDDQANGKGLPDYDESWTVNSTGRQATLCMEDTNTGEREHCHLCHFDARFATISPFVSPQLPLAGLALFALNCISTTKYPN